MAQPDRRLTIRLTDAEAAVITDIRAAQPHLTKSEVAHLMFEDKRETVAAALRATPVSTRTPVQLDQAALEVLDATAEALNDNGAQLRQVRALANQMARASNSGDPLVDAQMARLVDLLDGCFEKTDEIASTIGQVTSWHS